MIKVQEECERKLRVHLRDKAKRGTRKQVCWTGGTLLDHIGGLGQKYDTAIFDSDVEEMKLWVDLSCTYRSFSKKCSPFHNHYSFSVLECSTSSQPWSKIYNSVTDLQPPVPNFIRMYSHTSPPCSYSSPACSNLHFLIPFLYRLIPNFTLSFPFSRACSWAILISVPILYSNVFLFFLQKCSRIFRISVPVFTMCVPKLMHCITVFPHRIPIFTHCVPIFTDPFQISLMYSRIFRKLLRSVP
jgi:hypothetical protein